MICEVVFEHHFTVCPSKLFYGMPCPGCGSTRALKLLVEGHPLAAALMNPNIYIILAGSLAIAAALPAQAITGKDYLARMNNWLNQKKVLVPFFIFEFAIWIKNILMGI